MSDLSEILNIKQEEVEASKDGISLLSLKNQALLSYIHNMVLVMAAQVAKKQGESEPEVESIRQKAIEGTVTQRTVLEKGVKGLEMKLTYQLEKLARAYNRSKEEASKQQKKNQQDSDSDDDDDALAYRPRPNALTKAGADDEDADDNKKYKAPKIAAVTQFGREKKPERSRRNAVMEEYLKQSSDVPLAEPSIGTNIMDQGKGGLRSARDERQEKEQTQYEEENYKRLPGLSKKQSKREAKQRSRDAQGKYFFGEDWGFGNDIDVAASTKRKRKEGGGAWSKAKRKRDH